MSSEFRKEVFFDMETTGLSPFDSQIITIQVRVDGRNIVWPVWEGSEREVVGSFLSFTEEVLRLSTRFIGYNVLKFDVPFLTERMRSLGLLTFESWERLNRELNWFDLYQFLGDRFGRFREWKVGLTGRAVETVNREIPSLYAEENYDKILEYVQDEMEEYELVYNAIKRERFYSELMALRERLLK